VGSAHHFPLPLGGDMPLNHHGRVGSAHHFPLPLGEGQGEGILPRWAQPTLLPDASAASESAAASPGEATPESHKFRCATILRLTGTASRGIRHLCFRGCMFR
jgi:hypothetical protein